MLVYFDTPTGASYYGSSVAAPVFANIMGEVLPYMNVETKYTEDEISQMDTTAENYVGMSVSDAENLVAQGGFDAVIYGDGETVVSQVPTAESRLPQNGTVVLYTDEASISDDVVEVPDLTGMSVADANSTASYYNLNISIVGSNSEGEGISYSQDIAPGSKVKSGTVISVNFQQDSNYGSGVM